MTKLKIVKPPSDFQRVLILPDTHTPYHDARAVKLITDQVLPAFPWDIMVILGDWFDNYMVSTFTKDPRRLQDIEDELAEGFKLLDVFSTYSFQRRIFVEGNHERRLFKFLADKCPEVLKIVMKWWDEHFKKGMWEYVPYMDDTTIGRLFATHDVGRSGEHSTRLSLNDYQDNVIVGHNHLVDYHVRGNAKGTPHVGASFGWLGDVKQIDYRHRMKCRRDWSLGFGHGYLRPNGFVYLVPSVIIPTSKEYSCIVEGKLFKG